MGAGVAAFCAAALHAATPVAAVPVPKPGTLQTYGDWTLGCDNVLHCETRSLLAAMPEPMRTLRYGCSMTTPNIRARSASSSMAT